MHNIRICKILVLNNIFSCYPFNNGYPVIVGHRNPYQPKMVSEKG